jgi:hypothetical protein
MLFVFVVVILRVLTNSLTLSRSLEWLETLERDIVIHDIPINQVKDRLEREYLGSELGSWLQARVEEIKNRAEALERFESEARSKFAEIRTLDSELMFERMGRIEALTISLEKHHQELGALFDPLSKWLRKTYENPFQDPHLREVAKRTANDLARVMERATEASRRTIGDFKAMLKELRPTEERRGKK